MKIKDIIEPGYYMDYSGDILLVEKVLNKFLMARWYIILNEKASRPSFTLDEYVTDIDYKLDKIDELLYL